MRRAADQCFAVNVRLSAAPLQTRLGARIGVAKRFRRQMINLFANRYKAVREPRPTKKPPSS